MLEYAATSPSHMGGCGFTMFSVQRKNKEGKKDTAGEKLHYMQLVQ